MKFFSFRFDVDTPTCLNKGVPNLLKLADQKDCKFTFFVHMGRSISVRNSLNELLNGKQDIIENKKIIQKTAIEKLGIFEYFRLALFNPLMGENNTEIIKEIYDKGHEIGLHGGKNHDNWNRQVSLWDTSKVEDEISWGENELKKIIKDIEIVGFAGPHWKYTKKVYKVLLKYKYQYVSDRHTDGAVQSVRKSFGLINNVPVNIVGEPGGVGYLEWCRATGMNDSEILEDFKNKLKSRKTLATVYDHPYYAGVCEINTISEMIDIAKREKYKIVTFKEINKKL